MLLSSAALISDTMKIGLPVWYTQVWVYLEVKIGLPVWYTHVWVYLDVTIGLPGGIPGLCIS